MKENGLDVPYVFDRSSGAASWRFSLAYAPVASILAPAQKLLALSKLPRWERDAALAAQAAARQDAMAFDTSRLGDFSERILCSLPAAQVVPLTVEPGRFVVTGSRVYFQPLHNLGADNPVRSRPLSSIAAAARRRHVFRPVGIELLFADSHSESRGGKGWEASSVLLAFRSEKDRELALQVLCSQPQLGAQVGHGTAQAAAALLEGDPAGLVRVTEAWRRGDVANFEYLLYLNFAAGRSLNDLTQWCVLR